MPTANLKAAMKSGREVLADGHQRQAPEPRNRVMRRELVHDRRMTKRTLREMIAAGNHAEDWTPEHRRD